MKVSLIAPYSKIPGDVKDAAALSRFLINQAMNKRFEQGMPRTESRIFAKLLDRFYEEKPEIDIDESTFLLIKESLDQSALPPHMSSWKWTLLDHLDKIQKENEKRE